MPLLKFLNKMKIILLVCISLIFSCQTNSSSPDYSKYCNTRFQYEILYPHNLLKPQGESDNHDGQKFISEDGKAILTVWGANNIFPTSLEEEYDKLIDKSVTYKNINTEENWFAVSGIKNNIIYYIKKLLAEDTYLTFIFEYDENQKGIYDEVTSVMSESFEMNKSDGR